MCAAASSIFPRSPALSIVYYPRTASGGYLGTRPALGRNAPAARKIYLKTRGGNNSRNSVDTRTSSGGYLGTRPALGRNAPAARLDPAAHGMGAPKGSNGDRLGRLCTSNEHLHPNHIANSGPRIKAIAWENGCGCVPPASVPAFEDGRGLPCARPKP